MRPRGVGSSDAHLSWQCGVPIVTNPLLFFDLIAALCIAWAVSWLALIGLQLCLEGRVTSTNVTQAAIVACWLSFVFIAVFAFVTLVLLHNRYAVSYHMDDAGVHCENMQGKIRAEHRSLMRWQPFAIEPVSEPTRSVERNVSWAEISRIQDIPSVHTLLFQDDHKRTRMRIYCPDEQTYAAVFSFAAVRLNGTEKQ